MKRISRIARVFRLGVVVGGLAKLYELVVGLNDSKILQLVDVAGNLQTSALDYGPMIWEYLKGFFTGGF